MAEVFVCDAVRTPIGRFGGSLAKVRADDLAGSGGIEKRQLLVRAPRRRARRGLGRRALCPLTAAEIVTRILMHQLPQRNKHPSPCD